MKAIITGNNQQWSIPIGTIIEGNEIQLGKNLKYISTKDQYGFSIWVLSEDYKIIT
jgi:hypothetical protein